MMLRSPGIKLLLAGLVLLALMALSPLAWRRALPAAPAPGPQAAVSGLSSPGFTLTTPATLAWPLTYTPTASPTAPPTLTPRPTATFTLTMTTRPSSTASPTRLAAHDVPPFKVRHQWLSLDCEAASATQWAGYFGFKLTELDFQAALPRSDNPNFGFVGNVDDPWGGVPPQGYGVYAGPVADLLNKLGVPALAAKEYTLDQLILKIASDSSVIVWVVGHVENGTAYPIVDSQGRVALVAAYEHVILVTGYAPDEIHYISEGVAYTVSTPAFLKSWAILGNMVVVAP